MDWVKMMEEEERENDICLNEELTKLHRKINDNLTWNTWNLKKKKIKKS